MKINNSVIYSQATNTINHDQKDETRSTQAIQ